MNASERSLVVGLVLLAQVALPAEADTSISGFANASAVPALVEVAAAYERAHPGTTVHVLPAGSKIIVDNLNRGLSDDFVIIGESFVAKTTAIVAPIHLFSDRTALVVAPGAKGKIAGPADLAKGGIRLGWGSPGSNPDLLATQTLENLSAQFGGDFAARVKANIIVRRTDNEQLMKALAAGAIDAAIVYYSNTAAGDVETIDLGDKAVTAGFDGAAVKGSANAAAAKDFLAFVRGPQGQAIMHKYRLGP